LGEDLLYVEVWFPESEFALDLPPLRALMKNLDQGRGNPRAKPEAFEIVPGVWAVLNHTETSRSRLDTAVYRLFEDEASAQAFQARHTPAQYP